MKTLLDVMKEDKAISATRRALCNISEYTPKIGNPTVAVGFRPQLLKAAGLSQGDRVMPVFDKDKIIFRFDPNGWKLAKGSGWSKGSIVSFKRTPSLPIPAVKHYTEMEVLEVDQEQRMIVVRMPC